MDKKDFQELYVVEYSKRQGAFHIHTIKEMIEKNLEIFSNKDTDYPDFIPIEISETYERAIEIYHKYEKIVQEKIRDNLIKELSKTKREICYWCKYCRQNNNYEFFCHVNLENAPCEDGFLVPGDSTCDKFEFKDGDNDINNSYDSF